MMVDQYYMYNWSTNEWWSKPLEIMKTQIITIGFWFSIMSLLYENIDNYCNTTVLTTPGNWFDQCSDESFYSQLLTFHFCWTFLEIVIVKMIISALILTAPLQDTKKPSIRLKSQTSYKYCTVSKFGQHTCIIKGLWLAVCIWHLKLQ